MKISSVQHIAVLLIASFFHCAADETHVTTKRGAEVSVLAEFPTGNGPFPTVVLAPGQGYHMRLPVLVETTKQLIARGYAVYRFDWAYFTKDAKHGEPAEDLSTEVEDMRAVLDLARVDPRVDKTKMSVGGKSLGSLVAWQVFTTDKALRSGLFLTPVCSHTDAGKPPVSEATENYAGSHQETRPVAYISGDHDPLCSTPLLYRFAESAGGPARVAVVGGDHSFRVQNSAGAVLDAPSTHSVSLVADLATNFIDNTLRD